MLLASKTHAVLKDSGICEYTAVLKTKVSEGVFWVNDRIEENFPGYRKTVADFSEPYLQLASDMGKIACNGLRNVKNIIVEKYPVVIHSVSFITASKSSLVQMCMFTLISDRILRSRFD